MIDYRNDAYVDSLKMTMHIDIEPSVCGLVHIFIIYSSTKKACFLRKSESAMPPRNSSALLRFLTVSSKSKNAGLVLLNFQERGTLLDNFQETKKVRKTIFEIF